MTTYIARFVRASSMTGQVMEDAFSRPIHAENEEQARDLAYACDTFAKLMEQDQRWMLDGVMPA